MNNYLIEIKKGWNLVAFPLNDVNIRTIINNNNILEIKSINQSYNPNVPNVFNTLNNLNIEKGYFLKSKIDFNLELQGDRLTYNHFSKVNLNLLKKNITNEINKTIKLNKDWNFVGFFLESVNLTELLKDKRILEIKNMNESFNQDAPEEFNTLNEIDNRKGYFIKSLETFNLKIKGELIDYNSLNEEEIISIKKDINEKLISSIKNSKILNIPDSVFRKYLVDTYLAVDNGNQQIIINTDDVITINLGETSIKNLNGIENFTNLRQLNFNKTSIDKINLDLYTKLEELHCNDTKITELDTSKLLNLKLLECKNNKISSLNLSNNTNMTRLICSKLGLSSLDVSKLKSLVVFNCKNNNLTDLDISNNLTLEILGCSDNNLNKLDVSKQVLLKILECKNNKIYELNINNNIALVNIDCSNTGITKLNLINLLLLENLKCGNNKVSKLNISNNTKLINLFCNNTDIVNLDVSQLKYLKSLDCQSCKISKLLVDNNVNMIKLVCNNNDLFELDISKLAELGILECTNNKLSELNISNNIKLIRLICHNNNIIKLNISKLSVLAVLKCYSNKILELDFANNTNLSELICNDTDIRKLDVSKLSFLTILECQNTKLTELDTTNNKKLRRLICSNNDISNLDITNNKVLNQLECNSTYLFELDTINNVELDSLFCNSTNIRNLNLIENKNLKILNCSNNTIYDLNLDECTKLSQLICHDISINKLDLVNNQELTLLHCFKIPNLINLNISKNIELIDLNCDFTGIKNLDLTNNKKLKKLSCSNNKMNYINLSNNFELKELKCNNVPINDLNINNNLKLETLECSLTNIKQLNVNKNVELLRIVSKSNKINEIDVSSNIKLNSFNVSMCTNLEQLNLKNNKKLKDLRCSSTKLFNLDITNNTELLTLYCFRTQIQELNLLNNTKLEHFICLSTKIKELDLKNNKNLKTLRIEYNEFTTLNIENNLKLENLFLGKTKLKEIDVTKNTLLKELNCDFIEISNLDLTNNLELLMLDCTGTDINELDLLNNKKLTLLKCGETNIKELDLSVHQYLKSLECPNTNIIKLDLTNNKNLKTLLANPNPELVYIYLNNIDNIPETWTKPIQTIYTKGLFIDYLINNHNVKSVDGKLVIPDLKTINISKPNIFDVENLGLLTELETLICFDTDIKEINTLNNVKLKIISCARTKIEKLDFSQNPMIDRIYAMDCQELKEINLCNVDINKMSDFNCINCLKLKTIFVEDINNIPKNWKVPINVEYKLCEIKLGTKIFVNTHKEQSEGITQDADIDSMTGSSSNLNQYDNNLIYNSNAQTYTQNELEGKERFREELSGFNYVEENWDLFVFGDKGMEREKYGQYMEYDINGFPTAASELLLVETKAIDELRLTGMRQYDTPNSGRYYIDPVTLKIVDGETQGKLFKDRSIIDDNRNITKNFSNIYQNVPIIELQKSYDYLLGKDGLSNTVSYDYNIFKILNNLFDTQLTSNVGKDFFEFLYNEQQTIISKYYQDIETSKRLGEKKFDDKFYSTVIKDLQNYSLELDTNNVYIKKINFDNFVTGISSLTDVEILESDFVSSFRAKKIYGKNLNSAELIQYIRDATNDSLSENTQVVSFTQADSNGIDRNTISRTQFKNITADQLNSLSLFNVKKIKAVSLSSITKEQINGLKPDFMEKLTKEQIACLNPLIFSTLNKEQIIAISDKSVLTPFQLANINEDVIGSLVNEEGSHFLSDIGTDKIFSLRANQLAEFTDIVMETLNNKQVKKIRPSSVSYLTYNQVESLGKKVRQLNSDHIVNLNNDVISSLNKEDIFNLKYSVSGLSALQISKMQSAVAENLFGYVVPSDDYIYYNGGFNGPDGKFIRKDVYFASREKNDLIITHESNNQFYITSSKIERKFASKPISNGREELIKEDYTLKRSQILLTNIEGATKKYLESLKKVTKVKFNSLEEYQNYMNLNITDSINRKVYITINNFISALEDNSPSFANSVLKESSLEANSILPIEITNLLDEIIDRKRKLDGEIRNFDDKIIFIKNTTNEFIVTHPDGSSHNFEFTLKNYESKFQQVLEDFPEGSSYRDPNIVMLKEQKKLVEDEINVLQQIIKNKRNEKKSIKFDEINKTEIINLYGYIKEKPNDKYKNSLIDIFKKAKQISSSSKEIDNNEKERITNAKNFAMIETIDNKITNLEIKKTKKENQLDSEMFVIKNTTNEINLTHPDGSSHNFEFTLENYESKLQDIIDNYPEGSLYIETSILMLEEQINNIQQTITNKINEKQNIQKEYDYQIRKEEIRRTELFPIDKRLELDAKELDENVTIEIGENGIKRYSSILPNDTNKVALKIREIDENGIITDFWPNGETMRVIEGGIITEYNTNGELKPYLQDQIITLHFELWSTNSLLFSKIKFNQNGKISQEIMENGNTVNYAYNDTENMIQRTVIDGNGNTRVYDANENMIQRIVTDRNSNTTIYDANEKMIQRTTRDEGGNITVSNYNDKGNLKSIETRGDGFTRTDYKYDDKDNKISSVTSDDKGNVTVYDANENMIQQTITEEGGNTTVSKYDGKGNLKSKETHCDESGTRIDNQYDNKGNKISSVTSDNKGNSTKLDYDNNNNIISTETCDDKGNITKTDYDNNGNIIYTEICDDKGNITKTDYDNNGNIIYTEICDDKGNNTKTNYDNNGNLISFVTCGDEGVSKTIYQYSDNGTVIFSEIRTDEFVITTDHDDNGNKISSFTSEDKGVTITNYNDNGTIRTTETFTFLEGYTYTKYKYDNDGNLQSTETDGDKGHITMKYQYDNDGKLQSTHRSGEQGVITTEYDKNGNIISTDKKV